ncbi:MAG: F1F0 ATPase subunit 2 [Mariniblastus sp.]|jgi:F1F0 ATPase subunit 2
MTMNDLQNFVLPWASGVLLGAMFFGGLWWTVRKGLTSKNPALWFLVSPLLRMSVAMGGFYLVAGGQWERLMLCLVGFISARFVVARLTRLPSDNQTHLAKEASDAT